MKKIGIVVSILSFAVLLMGCPSITNPPSTSTTTSTTTTTTIVVPASVYVGGYLFNETTGYKSGYFKNNMWNNLQTPISNVLAVVNSIKVLGDNIYAVSYSPDIESIFGYWNNNNWEGLPVLNPLYTGSISWSHNAIGFFENDIYIAGWFDSNTTYDRYPVFWKNKVLTTLPIKDGYDSGQPNSIFIDSSDVYITGCISKSSPSEKESGYWKNEVWNSITDPQGNVTECNSIIKSGGDLFIQGEIDDGTSQNILGYWENGTWVKFSIPDVTKRYAMMSEMCLVNGDIYVAGQAVDRVDDTIRVAGYWKNGNWNILKLENGQDEGYSCIYDMTVYENDIYIVCEQNDSIGYWKNSVWNALDKPNGTIELMPQCIFVF